MQAIDFKVNSHKVLFTLLVGCILMIMFKSQRLCFTWSMPVSLVSILGAFLCSLYIIYNLEKYKRTGIHNLIIFSLLCLLFVYDFIVIGEVSILSIICLFNVIFVSAFLVLSDICLKERLLKWVMISTQILVGISLAGWILFLLNIPLPHYYSETDAYYTHTVYYFFVLNGIPEAQIIPRFAGMFLEPGHLGTMCCFLLYIGGYNLRKKGNIVLLLGVLLSLSLAGYGLLIGGYCLYILLNSQKGFIYIIIFIIFIVAVWGISSTYNAGDNYLNQKIFLRLVFEDGEMAGANRTTEFFDSQFERYVNTSKVWFGVGREAFDTRAATNLINGCAGWKRYFFLRGYFGLGLLVSFWLLYFYRYYSKQALGFFVVYIVANIIRDYPLKEYWLFLFIIAIPVLTNNSRDTK